MSDEQGALDHEHKIDFDSLVFYVPPGGNKAHRSPACAGWAPDNAAIEIYGGNPDLGELKTIRGSDVSDTADLCDNCADQYQGVMHE